MDITSITLGKQNTAATLFAGLEKATGFKNYQVYHGGKAVDPEEIDVCRKLEDLNFTGLLLVRKRDDAEGVPDPPNGNKTTLELEITKHFDDLWSYLSMNEKVAQEVCYTDNHRDSADIRGRYTIS
jgi:ubiquitin carboxyl-terminal hydrolase 34